MSVFLEITRDGITGHGEAPANAYYKEDAADVAGRLGGMGTYLAGREIGAVEDIAEVWKEAWTWLAPSRAAQCALDVALWDWLGRRRGRSVAELALGAAGGAVVSFATVGISEPRELEAKLGELAGFPRIKVKTDQTGNLATVRRVRDAMPGAMIAVDANCAWGDVDAGEVGAELGALGVEFVEQPMAPGRDAEMGEWRRRVGAPVMADESCVAMEDVERAEGYFDGINIKLVKCGGLTPALRMARRGREMRLKTMVGCMLESSVLIAAGAVAAQLTDYADLDGAWLLGDDPAEGWGFERGVLTPSGSPGLGVRMREG
jgi:L-alanine-DL-glutamate epimerase-like enolase superfamily enzyme